MVFPEVVPWVMVSELLAHFVTATGALLLTLAAVLDAVGAILSKIRSPVGPIALPTVPRSNSVSLATVPRGSALSLAPLPRIGTFALPTLSTVRVVQERCCRPTGHCSGSSSRRRTR
jgi:hypothetical protein